MNSDRTETASGAVDSGSQDLLERSELLGESRLKIETKLELGNCRHNVFPVLSDLEEKKSATLDVERIQVGTKLMSGDTPIHGLLDLENPLSRDTGLLPLGDRIGGHTEPPGQLCLRHNPEDGVQSAVVHIDDYIHRRLMRVNHHLIADDQPTADHKRMVDTPRPEHYATFPQWLIAIQSARKVTQRAIATIAGTKPQAVTKWLKGGGVEPEPLRKLANWAGVEYSALRLLLDGQPQETGRQKKQFTQQAPATMRIARKIDLLKDEVSLTAVESLVDTLLSSAASQKRTTK